MKNKYRIATALAGIMLLIAAPTTAMKGASAGIEQCIRVIIPSLFPFFFLSTLLCSDLSGLNLPFWKPLSKALGLAAGCEGILILGFLGGYPTGAQAVASAYHDGLITSKQAKRLLGFCSNAGPSFIFGIVSSLFPSPIIGLIIWGIHMVSAVLVGYLLPGKEAAVCHRSITAHISIPEALWRSIKITATVCAWVTVFRIFLDFLNSTVLDKFPPSISIGVAGFLELANGCINLQGFSQSSVRFILCCTMLAFGGLCVGMQTCSAVGSLGTGMYFPGKVLQSVFSLILAMIMCPLLYPAECAFTLTALWGIILLLTVIILKKVWKSKA